MSIHFEKVLTDPLGLAGYALFLVFSVVTWVVKQRKPTNQLIVPGGFALATICVIGGLSLAYSRQPVALVATPPTVAAPGPSMTIGNVDQKVTTGNAVTGVQGPVTINPEPPPKDSKPKP